MNQSAIMEDSAATVAAPVNDFGCVNNTIRLRSGLYFDLANPDPATIRIDDIAGALSKTSRFGGHGDVNWHLPVVTGCWWFPRWLDSAVGWILGLLGLSAWETNYSVAEHCVLCARQAVADGLPAEAVFAVLLHDAPEAFTGDMVRPFKIMMPQYREIESRVTDAVGFAFGIDFDRWHAQIKKIDNEMVLAERRVLFSPDGVVWVDEATARVLTPEFRCMLPRAAERAFLECYSECVANLVRDSGRGAA